MDTIGISSSESSNEGLEQEAEKVSKDLIHVLVCNEIYKRRHGGRRGMIAFL